ncbi:hypothetical protein HMPREF2907_08905 [Neisseria sp. HMSC055H02]|nr:hypothetical protein HMPREF2907_08905 [Neisseria sp. HMSC055H02]
MHLSFPKTSVGNVGFKNPTYGLLPDNSSADKQSDNDSGADKMLDLLNKIVDFSSKKSMGN